MLAQVQLPQLRCPFDAEINCVVAQRQIPLHVLKSLVMVPCHHESQSNLVDQSLQRRDARRNAAEHKNSNNSKGPDVSRLCNGAPTPVTAQGRSQLLAVVAVHYRFQLQHWHECVSWIDPACQVKES